MPNRIAMDLVALVDIGLVILAAAVAKFLYNALYLEDAQAPPFSLPGPQYWAKRPSDVIPPHCTPPRIVCRGGPIR